MNDYKWKETMTPNWDPVSFAASCIYKKSQIFTGGWNPIDNLFNSNLWKQDKQDHWEKMPIKNSFNPRNGHSLSFFKDRVYLIGGFNYESKYLRDIWVLDLDNSIIEWKCIQDSPPWEGREGHQALVFQNSLWVFGGITKSGVRNDIWASKDGINWEGDFETPPWSPRCFHNIHLYNNKIWLIAGSSTDGANNDMHVSKNGKNWELYDATLPFTPRFGSGVTIFDDRIWLFGGSDAKESEFFNDIWWFSEKEGWNELHINTPWKPRWGFNCVQSYLGNINLLCGGVRFPDRKYSAYADGWVLQKN